MQLPAPPTRPRRISTYPQIAKRVFNWPCIPLFAQQGRQHVGNMDTPRTGGCWHFVFELMGYILQDLRTPVWPVRAVLCSCAFTWRTLCPSLFQRVPTRAD